MITFVITPLVNAQIVNWQVSMYKNVQDSPAKNVIIHVSCTLDREIFNHVI